MILIIQSSFLSSQTSHFLDSLLHQDLPQYSALLDQPAKYKLQIIFTTIDRDKENKPHFNEFKYRISKKYFYPASTVKLPISILGLQKIEELKEKGIDRKTAMLADSVFFCQEKIKADSTSSGSFPTLENYIKRMMLVSDNAAFTRMYEFVGYDYAHKKLKEQGFGSVRLFNRLSPFCKGDTALITPPVNFLNSKGDTLYKQVAAQASFTLNHPIKSSMAGRAHINANGKRVYSPKDFSRHNYFHLTDLNRMMQQLIFMEAKPEKGRIKLTEESRTFLVRQMGLYPKESDYPVYDKKVFYDSYKKYFMYASAVATITQDSIRVINIVGRAYGFLIDCAYIIDMKSNTEFLLTAALYVNEGNIIGNGKYEYDQLGLPFMRDLSLVLYKYERNRKKENVPDLSEYKKMFNYKSNQ
ncbi:MAG TPA: serine hydrolase [Bacteroidia bacterium]|nr:serine hydrolase [Bacteroidia bacterium]